MYEDSSCIVINKPAGLAVQGGKSIGVSLDSILAENYPQRPLLVHRLDRDTSGIILVARTKTAAAWFSGLLGGEGGAPAPAEKGVVKRYLAICRGRPQQAEGTIRLDLAIRGAVKKSATRYRLLSSCCGEEDDFSLLELELGTGRMHQIRRHLAMTGNPVLGDDKYGDFGLNRRLRRTMGVRRLMLHASRLIIPKMPATGAENMVAAMHGSPPAGSRLDISAPLPEHFVKFLEISAMI